jgi:hypothetical protein
VTDQVSAPIEGKDGTQGILGQHLQLQAQRTHRMVRDMGLHPLVNYLVIAGVFIFLSYFILFLQDGAKYAYALVPSAINLARATPRYATFLRLAYPRRECHRIRLAENLIISLPFAVVLFTRGEFLLTGVMLMLSALPAFFSVRLTTGRAIPTPFSRFPFEFPAGFRLGFPVILFAYYLAYASVKYDNYGIGVFALMLVCLVCGLFQLKVEDYYYVWIFRDGAGKFLLRKMATAALCTLALCLPILVLTIIRNPGVAGYILAAQADGLAFCCAAVLCKYSGFPDEIGQRDGLILMFSFLFPPVLLFSIPFLHAGASKSLKEVLQ